MIRAFISTWQFIPEEMRVTNPILEHGGALVSGEFTCSMLYPDADQDGKPDGAHVLVLVKGDSLTVESLKDLSGVKMLPAYRLTKPVSEIPANAKQAIRAYVVDNNIAPVEIFDGVVVYGDFLKRLAKHFQVDFNGFGKYESVDELEFG